MWRELQLSIETPVNANHRSLRRCHGCGNYTRPFVEMEGTIRCERCAKKNEGTDDREKESLEGIENYGAIS